jgi:hypothetical protein
MGENDGGDIMVDPAAFGYGAWHVIARDSHSN